MKQVEILIQDVDGPLGRIALGGHLLNHTGTPLNRDWLIRGAYSLACITKGEGRYQDLQGRSQNIQEGDLILVFPEIAHRYGPEPPATWNETFVIFDGPFFDLCRGLGLIRPTDPIAHLKANAEAWCQEVIRHMTAYQNTRSTKDFQSLASTMLDPFFSTADKEDHPAPQWLENIKATLDRLEPGIELETLAKQAGITTRTLQRQFHLHTGSSPQQYRDERRLRVATELLTHVPGIKMHTVAQRLGFANEFYFSRWFRKKVGITPSKWRSNNS